LGRTVAIGSYWCKKGYLLVSKKALPPSCGDCLQILGSSTPGALRACPDL
jgi:hypothetical protein